MYGHSFSDLSVMEMTDGQLVLYRQMLICPIKYVSICASFVLLAVCVLYNNTCFASHKDVQVHGVCVQAG